MSTRSFKKTLHQLMEEMQYLPANNQTHPSIKEMRRWVRVVAESRFENVPSKFDVVFFDRPRNNERIKYQVGIQHGTGKYKTYYFSKKLATSLNPIEVAQSEVDWDAVILRQEDEIRKAELHLIDLEITRDIVRQRRIDQLNGDGAF